MRRRHKKFNAHKFLDKFQGNEEILGNYVRSFGDRINLDANDLSIDGFKEYLGSDANDEGREQFLEELYRIYDMSCGNREKCHEELISACKQMTPPFDPDPDGKLPPECLAMKVQTENLAAFDLAYNMESYRMVDGFSFFKGASGIELDDVEQAALGFQAKLEESFDGEKDSDRVRVSSYQEDGTVNFVVYHEKRMVSELVFGPKKTIKVHPFRPLQQDFIGYTSSTGQLEIKARFKKEVDTLRTAFGRRIVQRQPDPQGDE